MAKTMREDQMHSSYDYDKNTDYKSLMDQAAASGDYASAARYEQQRNAKIAGEGLKYSQTNQYSQYATPSAASLQGNMNQIMNQILNRQPFSYDMNGDALYQQYKDQYTRQGRLAMQDTMGQATALTGGYGNSYAQQVGQQAYYQQLGQLNDVIPELYALARDRYDREGDRLLTQYNLYADRENAAYQRERAADETAYQREQDAYQRERAADETAYQREQDAYQREQAEKDAAYNLAMTLLSAGAMPSAERLQAAGLTAEEAKALLDGLYSGVNFGGYSGSYTVNPEDTVVNNDPAPEAVAQTLGETALWIANQMSRANSTEVREHYRAMIAAELQEGNITPEEAEILANAIGIP